MSNYFEWVFVTNGDLRNMGKLHYDFFWRTKTVLLCVENKFVADKQIKQCIQNTGHGLVGASEPIT
jgi:hypothetical protein